MLINLLSPSGPQTLCGLQPVLALSQPLVSALTQQRALALEYPLAVLSMGWRVLVEKLSPALHICRMIEESLARKVLEEQQLYGWPGLAGEAEQAGRGQRQGDTQQQERVQIGGVRGVSQL